MRRSTRERGPWERVGALIQSSSTSGSDSGSGSNSPRRKQTLPLFVRQNGRWQDRFDYRTIVNDVPLEINKNDRGVFWINDGEAVQVPGVGDFVASVYVDFR
jgi:hypothetical protein